MERGTTEKAARAAGAISERVARALCSREIRWIDRVIQRSFGIENGTRKSGVPVSDFITSMRLLWLRCVRGFGLLCAFVTVLTSATQVSSQSIADIVDRVRPSVAFVLSQGDNQTASGSAFVVDPAGLL